MRHFLTQMFENAFPGLPYESRVSPTECGVHLVLWVPLDVVSAWHIKRFFCGVADSTLFEDQELHVNVYPLRHKEVS